MSPYIYITVHFKIYPAYLGIFKCSKKQYLKQVFSLKSENHELKGNKQMSSRWGGEKKRLNPINALCPSGVPNPTGGHNTPLYSETVEKCLSHSMLFAMD